jgi:hypothetical protein
MIVNLKYIPSDFFKEIFLQVNKLFFDEINYNPELKPILKIINENFNEINMQNNSINEMDIQNNNYYNIIACDGTVNNRIQNSIKNTP